MAARTGIPTGPDNPLRRSARWTALRRETYLAVLRATGNARAAAEAIGMDRRTIEHRREKDPGFARDCAAALDEADGRLKGQAADAVASGETDAPAEPDPFEVIRRGPNGRMQIAAAGTGRWSGRTEAIFIAELRRTGNMSAAARAAGFSLNSALDRRRKLPRFAKRIDEALEDAEIVLEFRLGSLGGGPAEAAETAEDAVAPAEPPFDPEFALKFLKWREEKRNGGGGRGRPGLLRREPSIEEVRDDVMRRLAAIRRHRERYGTPDSQQHGNGDSHE